MGSGVVLADNSVYQVSSLPKAQALVSGIEETVSLSETGSLFEKHVSELA